MGPGGPRRPLPTLSSWQMKEPKQSSPALSNPLAPRDQTHPRPVGGGGWGGGPGVPNPFSSSGPRGGRRGAWRTRARQFAAPSGPAGASVARGGGVRRPRSRTSRSGNSLPHSLSLQLCRGLANGKRKLGQRKQRRAPRLKNPDKRRGPPAPAGQPPGSGHGRPGPCPLPWPPRESRPPAYRPPAPPPAPGNSRSAPDPLRPPAPRQPGSPAAVPAVPAPCALRCARRAGAPRPGPTASAPAVPGPPRPRAERLTWGGRGSERGGIPTRQKATPFIGRQRRLCGRGAVGGARAGTREGRGRPELRPLRSRRGARAASPPGAAPGAGAPAGPLWPRGWRAERRPGRGDGLRGTVRAGLQGTGPNRR